MLASASICHYFSARVRFRPAATVLIISAIVDHHVTGLCGPLTNSCACFSSTSTRISFSSTSTRISFSSTSTRISFSSTSTRISFSSTSTRISFSSTSTRISFSSTSTRIREGLVGARHCGAPLLRRYAATSALFMSMACLSAVLPSLQGR